MAAIAAPSSGQLAAVILAAGLGRRLGCIPKAALRFGDTTILEGTVGALRASDVAQVSLVIGPYRDQLLPLAVYCGVNVLEHRLERPSLADSQRLALNAHVANFPHYDLLLVLADLPLLSCADIRHLTDHWWHRAPKVQALMPVVNGARGHPLLLSSEAVSLALATPADRSIRDWLTANVDVTWKLPCSQRSYVTDVDTEEDLRRLQALLEPSPWK